LPKKCVSHFWLALTRHFLAGTDGQTQPVKSGLESRLHSFDIILMRLGIVLLQDFRPIGNAS